MHKMLSALLFLVSALFVAGCQAESDSTFEAGKDYFVLPQAVRTSDPAKIEVAEVFWYGCAHCFKYFPSVAEWAKVLPEDVAFVRNPATLGRRKAEVHTRAYYTAKALGNTEEMHPKLFAAMHKQKKRLANEREIGDIFVDAGVDRDKFSSVFNSFGVISQSMQAESRAKGYRITGTPCIIVNGKYRITGESAGSNDGMMKIAEFLIEKERKAAR